MPHDILPILNKVVVKPEEPREQTEGGIYIPETAKKRGLVGYVIAVGPEVDREQVDIGDKVLFDEYSGTNIKVDGIGYTIMVMKDIMVVLKEKAEK